VDVLITPCIGVMLPYVVTSMFMMEEYQYVDRVICL